MPWEKVHDPEEAAALEPEQTDYAREAPYRTESVRCVGVGVGAR